MNWCLKTLPVTKKFDRRQQKRLFNTPLAAKIFDEVAMEQDHEMNPPMKKALEEAAQTNTHAAKALKLFTSVSWCRRP